VKGIYTAQIKTNGGYQQNTKPQKDVPLVVLDLMNYFC